MVIIETKLLWKCLMSFPFRDTSGIKSPVGLQDMSVYVCNPSTWEKRQAELCKRGSRTELLLRETLGGEKEVGVRLIVLMC